jgi:hypothetical protein
MAMATSQFIQHLVQQSADAGLSVAAASSVASGSRMGLDSSTMDSDTNQLAPLFYWSLSTQLGLACLVGIN